MRTPTELAGIIEFTKADYLRDVARQGLLGAKYMEGMLVGLLFAYGLTMQEAHEEIDKILAERKKS